MNKQILTISQILLLSAFSQVLQSCGSEEISEPPSPLLPTDDDSNNPDKEDEEDIPTGPKKNVLFIMSDDFNYWAKCIGYCDYSITPNIDALAAKGVLFTNAYCSSPVSNPSRNALWSGYRPSTTGIDNNSGGYVRDQEGFQNIVTMNQYFKNNGYYVLGSGKLYHPGQMGGYDTDPDNWTEIYKDGTGSNASGGVSVTWKNPSWETMIYKIGNDASNENNTADLALVNKVAKFITEYENSEHADQPFFIGCGVFRPHLPWNVSSEFWNQYDGVNISTPKGYVPNDPLSMNNASHSAVVSQGQWTNSMRAYLSCMTMSDKHVGILLQALENSKYKDNTVVVFMGDHGWHLGEKDNWGKNTIYNPANRTTLVIYDPSRAGDKHICDIPVSLQDIYLTLVKLCNIPKNKDIEGNDISSLIENPQRTDWNVPVMSTYSGTNYVQDRYYKYIDDPKGKKLFNIVNDPYETTNLYSQLRNTIAKVYHAKIDSILEIGNAIKKRLEVKSSVNQSGVLTSQYPFGVLKDCSDKYVVDRVVVNSIDYNSNTLHLNLLSSDHITELSLFDKYGNLLEKAEIIGEMEEDYKSEINLSEACYLRISDDKVFSIEKLLKQ